MRIISSRNTTSAHYCSHNVIIVVVIIITSMYKYLKKTYQLKTLRNDDVIISVNYNSKDLFGNPRCQKNRKTKIGVNVLQVRSMVRQ